jgi:hypothetical protein
MEEQMSKLTGRSSQAEVPTSIVIENAVIGKFTWELTPELAKLMSRLDSQARPLMVDKFFTPAMTELVKGFSGILCQPVINVQHLRPLMEALTTFTNDCIRDAHLTH